MTIWRVNADQWIKPVLREPLLHFLVVGGLLYVLFGQLHATRTDDAHSRIVVVDRKGLVDFLQYRAKTFRPDVFGEQLDSLSPAERKSLIDDFVREEVLYREAKAIGLQEGDYVIRQRMIQRITFLLEDSVADSTEPAPQILEQYFKTHLADYQEAPSYTFTHVFFDSATRGSEAAKALAQKNLAILRARRTPFGDAARYGDRFPFLQNYVERTRDFVAAHFGANLTGALDAATPDDATWQGPFESSYGWHLVLLTQRLPARVPELSALRQRVIEDYRRDQVESDRRAAIDRLVAHYEIRMSALTPAPR